MSSAAVVIGALMVKNILIAVNVYSSLIKAMHVTIVIKDNLGGHPK